MQAEMSRNARSDSVSLLLAGGLSILPFLLPYPQLFQAEWLAAALGVTAALAALSARGTKLVALPGPALWLGAFAIAMSAVSLYYYLQVLKQIYVAEVPADAPAIHTPLSSNIALGLLALGVLVLGIAPNLVLEKLLAAIKSVGY